MLELSCYDNERESSLPFLLLEGTSALVFHEDLAWDDVFLFLNFGLKHLVHSEAKPFIERDGLCKRTATDRPTDLPWHLSGLIHRPRHEPFAIAQASLRRWHTYAQDPKAPLTYIEDHKPKEEST